MINAMIRRLAGRLLIAWGFIAVIPVLLAGGMIDGALVIEGTGDSQALLREIAARFEERYPGTTIQIPDSIGSSGGIKAVGSGQAELGRVARPLQEKEQVYGLSYKVFALSPVVIVTHPSVTGVDNLTSEQIVGIYSGAITDWQELGGTPHKMYPIGREVGDSSRAIIGAYIPEFPEIQESSAKTYYTTPETIQAIEEHAYTIGYVPRAMIDINAVRVLSVDGIAPSSENMKQGRYRMVVPFGIVYKEPLGALAQAFVDFLFSPEARETLKTYGCFPIEPQ